MRCQIKARSTVKIFSPTCLSLCLLATVSDGGYIHARVWAFDEKGNWVFEKSGMYFQLDQPMQPEVRYIVLTIDGFNPIRVKL